MRTALATIILFSTFVLGVSSGFAQGYPYRYHYRAPSPGGYVLGPAYGLPGEPLGPAYWNRDWPGNPRACGPGLCQDDPRY